MDNTFNPLKKKKKISFDLNEELLEVVDGLAVISKNHRSAIIEALIGRGMIPFVDYLEKTWKRYLVDKKYEKIKPEMEKLIKDLKKFKEKHELLNPDYYLKTILSKKDLNEDTKKKLIKALKDMNLMPTDKKKR